ncbi:MAG: DUF2142 domain-containing protein [Burkholderiales bacterium]|nr:DUF2142 domain-containing protein [Burkholderiales bacterium]
MRTASTTWPPPLRLRWVLPAWLLVMLTGAALMIHLPPLQSPDEGAHIGRAYLLGHGQWLLDPPAAFDIHGASAVRFVSFRGELIDATQRRPMSGGWVDAALANWGLNYLADGARRSAGPAVCPSTSPDAAPWQAQSKIFVELAGTGYYLPLAYLPHAAGLRIGEALGLSVESSYRLTRWLVFGLLALVTVRAFAIWVPPAPMLALLMLPATLYQVLSPTLDGITMASFVLALAFCVRAWRDRMPLDWGELSIVGACLALVLCTRLQMLPLLLLPLAVAWRTRSLRCLALVVVLAVAVPAWIWFAAVTTVDTRVVRPAGTLHYLLHYLTFPAEFMSLLGATLADTGTLRFYLSSFIGRFGAADIKLPLVAYSAISALLLAAWWGGAQRIADRDDAVLRGTLLVAAISSALLTFLALLAGWTPQPAQRIEGVQGRYLLMPAMLAAVAIAGIHSIPRSRHRWAYAASTGIAALAVAAMPIALQSLCGTD